MSTLTHCKAYRPYQSRMWTSGHNMFLRMHLCLHFSRKNALVRVSVSSPHSGLPVEPLVELLVLLVHKSFQLLGNTIRTLTHCKAYRPYQSRM